MSTPIRRSAKPPLRWRREPPDVPGWWWHRRTGANADLVYCDVASVEWHASQVARAVARGGAEWAGPIPEPAEHEA